MNKKIISLIIAVTCLFAVIAFAAEEIPIIAERSEPVQINGKEVPDDFCDDPMFELIRENYSDETERETAMLEYAKRKALGETENNKDYLYSCVENGADIINLLKAYDFWLETNESVEIVGKMCDYYDSEDNNWVKNAYYAVSDNAGERLTKEELETYFKNGLTEKQINFAENMSLKGKSSIKEILERLKNKENVLSIYESECGENFSFLTKMRANLQGAGIENYQKLEAAAYLHKVTDESFLSLMKEDDLEEKINDYRRKTRENARNKLIKSGLISENQGKREEQIRFEDRIHQMVLEMGVSEEEIAELKNMNYGIVQIYNMKLDEHREE